MTVQNTKANSRSMFRYALLVASSLLFLGAKCNCQIGGGIDPKKVEEAIMNQSKAFGVTSVKCPDSIDGKAGSSFECTYNGPGGKPGALIVKVEDDKGNITWKDKNPPPAPAPAQQTPPAQQQAPAQEEDMAEEPMEDEGQE